MCSDWVEKQTLQNRIFCFILNIETILIKLKILTSFTWLRVGQRELPEDTGWLFSYIPISVVVVTVTGCSVTGVSVGASSVVVVGSQTSVPYDIKKLISIMKLIFDRLRWELPHNLCSTNSWKQGQRDVSKGFIMTLFLENFCKIRFLTGFGGNFCV